MRMRTHAPDQHPTDCPYPAGDPDTWIEDQWYAQLDADDPFGDTADWPDDQPLDDDPS